MGITIFKIFMGGGGYIVGYTLGNHVLQLHLRVAVKLNIRPYIRQYTSPNENFEYSYPLIIIAVESSLKKVQRTSFHF